jgi:hypothetical protein
MESNDASAQLNEAARLRSETIRESRQAPRGTQVAMVIAMIIFFTAYGLSSDAVRSVLWIGWLLFMVGWLVVLRRGRRAQPRRIQHTRREAVEWVVLFVVANVIVAVFSRVSWALVGILLASLGALAGATHAWKSRNA